MRDKKIDFYYQLIKKLLFVAVGYFLVSVASFFVIKQDYQLYFSNNDYHYDTTIVDQPPASKYTTSVKYDNVYVNDSIKTENDAVNLIISDSDLQKSKCTNKEIIDIENRIQKNYGIVAVNLCELDTDFALEIENVIKDIYQEFPIARGYMSNLTLWNTTNNSSTLASFNYGYIFSTSSKNRGYPWVIKNQLLLNSNYFLDTLTLQNTIKTTERTGYFPKNVTRYSVVAHEFGHYLSFIAVNENYNVSERFLIKSKMNYTDYYKARRDYNNGTFAQKIIAEAYEEYNKKNKNLYETIDDFRGSISNYALVIDSKGQYIYDETIAEAYHDYYLNGSEAQPASLAIMKVLKSYLK